MRLSNTHARASALLAMFAAAAVSLHAVDGVVLINQAAALNGNVTPGDTPGFPVTISAPGSYRLSSNLTVADVNTTAIQILASNVTIDLNGFSIIGPVSCSGNPVSCPQVGMGVGIQSTDVDVVNLKVFNGNVQGMGSHGIHLFGSFNIIEKVHASSNAGVGIIADGLVSQSSASLNGSNGINAFSVISSSARRNGGAGIFVGRGGSVINNVTEFNAQQGIFAICVNAIVSNTAVGNFGQDIETFGSGCTRANNAPAP